jgi:hypothetical protein
MMRDRQPIGPEFFGGVAPAYAYPAWTSHWRHVFWWGRRMNGRNLGGCPALDLKGVPEGYYRHHHYPVGLEAAARLLGWSS